jgi:hypothetical protein
MFVCARPSKQTELPLRSVDRRVSGSTSRERDEHQRWLNHQCTCLSGDGGRIEKDSEVQVLIGDRFSNGLSTYE